MNDEVKIVSKPTKITLNHFRSEDYTLPLMLSEFIDNSISSWEEKNTEDNLKIEINFIENKINDKFDREIQIRDNANGIDFYNMDEVGKFYDSKNKNQKDLNQHGIGLKSSIGWLGKDGTIYSKTKNESQMNVLKFHTSKSQEQDEWYPTKSQEDYNSKILLNENGSTTIIINELYNENLFDFIRGESEEKTSALLTFLGWKYRYYIRNGLLIQLSFMLTDNNDIQPAKKYLVSDFDIKPWKLSDFINFIKDKINKKNPNVSPDIETNKIIDDFKQSIKIIRDKSDILSIKSKICEMMLRDEEVFIEDDTFINNEKYKIKYGIISPSSIKHISAFNDNVEYCKVKKRYGYEVLQGVSTFHHNRGIEIGPNLNKDFWKGKIPETISFCENRKTIDSISTPIRLYGEIHIDNLRTEINKATLFWIGKDRFIDSLQNIWSMSFKEILFEVAKAEKLAQAETKLNNKSIQNIKNLNTLKMKFDDDNPTIINFEKTKDKDGNESNKWTYTSIYKNKKYIFELIESKLNDNRPFECNEIDDNHYSIKYDFNHSIWCPFNKTDSANIRTLSHPIIVTIALAQWIIDDNKKSTYSNSINEKINIFDIIDEIVKKWEFKENDK